MKPHVLAGVAARSGGHILPCLTLIEQEKEASTTTLFFTSHTDLDDIISKQFPWITTRITLHLENVPYKKPWRFPLFCLQFITCFIKSMYYLIKHRPQKLISTGGYLSIPVCLAAKVLRIPLELFELNVIPGKATKFLAPLSNSLFTCFTQSNKHFKKAHTKNYPLRFSPEITNILSQQQALAKLGYNTHKKTILILGGSQGSTFLNSQLCNTLSALDGSSLQVIHQTGKNDVEALKAFYNGMAIPAHVFAYEQDLTTYYQAADIVICRSGAGTLFETAFFKKRCITIPLEITSNTHQVDNAYAIQEQYPHFFTVLRQIDLQKDSSLLLKELLHLQHQPTL